MQFLIGFASGTVSLIVLIIFIGRRGLHARIEAQIADQNRKADEAYCLYRARKGLALISERAKVDFGSAKIARKFEISIARRLNETEPPEIKREDISHG